jgi:hypothetical protein
VEVGFLTSGLGFSPDRRETRSNDPTTNEARLRYRLVLPVLIFAALLAPSALAAAPHGAQAKPSKPKYTVYGSCANGKPFKASRHCRYDKSRLFRATFVFESHVGKRPVKSCFRIYGPKPLGGGHACQKLGPLAYKAYPFKVSGIRLHFSVKVTWFVKAKKGGGWKQAGASFMKARP